MKKKIKKVTPIKSETLCEKCNNEKCAERGCSFCKMNIGNFNKVRCYCNSVECGEKCERYERKPPSLQIGDIKITNTEIVYSPKDKKSEV